MKLRIKKVNADEIKVGTSIAQSWQHTPNIIVVTEDNTCIFGEGLVNVTTGDVEVIEVSDCDTEQLCLSMHSSGKFAKYDYQRVMKMDSKKIEQFGIPALSFIDMQKFVNPNYKEDAKFMELF